MSALTPFQMKQATVSLETTGVSTEKIPLSTKEMKIVTVSFSVALAGLTGATVAFGAETMPFVASMWVGTTAFCSYMDLHSSLSRKLQFWRSAEGKHISIPGVMLNFFRKDKHISIYRNGRLDPEFATLVINRGQVSLEKPILASTQWDDSMKKVQNLYGLPEKRKIIDMRNSNCPVERMRYKQEMHRSF